MPRRRRSADQPEPQRDQGTVSETAEGIPDEAVGPAQSSIPDLLDLAEGQDAQAMADKLKIEIEARRSAGEEPPDKEPDGSWRD